MSALKLEKIVSFSSESKVQYNELLFAGIGLMYIGKLTCVLDHGDYFRSVRSAECRPNFSFFSV